MSGAKFTVFSASLGVCPVCGGKLIQDPQDGDRLYCDTCAYDTADPSTWDNGEEA